MLGTVLALVASEVVLRTWLVSPSISVADASFGWGFQPCARIVQSTEGWSRLRTNSMGLLDDELRVPRARVRAVLLGDSFTEALQVARRDNFDSVAERRMPGLEVVSVGYSGRSPVEYADWLEEYGPRLAPDVVVVQLNDWDLDELLLPAAQTRLAAAARRGGAPPAPAGHRESPRARFLRRILHSSSLANVAWRRVVLVTTALQTNPPRPFRQSRAPAANAAPVAGVADPRMPAIMDALHRRIAAHAPRLLYLYIPSLDYFGPRVGYGEPRVAAFYHAFAVRNDATLVDPLDAFRAEFARTGQPLHGFSNSVLGSGHINVSGHRVVGERLARAIAGALR
jgi:lysophospholipase L1-like esterase